MTTFRKYLGYILKKSSVRTLVFTICSVAVVLFSISQSLNWSYHMADYPLRYSYLGIEYLAIMIGIFSTVIPMLETSEFKNRRNLDTLYFLPISRIRLALAHYISGFIQVAFIHTVSFWSAFIYWVINIKPENYIRSLNILPIYWLLSLAVGLITYSIFIFIFGIGNTVLDGIIFCIAWMFIGWMITNFAANLFGDILKMENVYQHFEQWYMAWTIVYMPINNLTMIFQGMTELRDEYFIENVEYIIDTMYMFFVWLSVAGACVFGYFWTFIRKGAEKAGEISSSWFGYKALIPIYAICLIVELSTASILNILIWILVLVGYIIYRRGFKFKICDIISMSIFFVIYVGTLLL